MRGATMRLYTSQECTAFQSTRPCGARRLRDGEKKLVTCFNPRAHAGRDHKDNRNILPSKFQSTRPCGARHDQFRKLCVCYSFNPRAHAGRDETSIEGKLLEPVSIHAPMRGATICTPSSVSQMKFQSTRPCGARREGITLNKSQLMFQSTRPCGARHQSL